MVAKLPDISFPELFIGFVAPIGVDVNSCVDDFASKFRDLGYEVVEIKVTDIFNRLKSYITPKIKLEEKPLHERYTSYIAYGNQLRAEFGDDGFLAAITISRIFNRQPLNSRKFSKVVYLMHQFKRKEEIDLLRSVYGRLFFQVSIYSRRGARVDYLAHTFANSDNSANIDKYRSQAEHIVQVDVNESDEHGQKVSKIFHDADVIISSDAQEPIKSRQVSNFCDLLFGANWISPNKLEYGMFAAKAAALRTLDLSRQVGAAIFTPGGEVISIGSNEVPKGLGGTYWCDDPGDDREYVRERDSNDRRKREILGEITGILNLDLNDVLNNPEIEASQFMDALEYGRIVHAEMSAISDAARLGRSVQGGILYCTAFPCHMCAKHIVAAGIKKVFFLEPYPKVSYWTSILIQSLSRAGIGASTRITRQLNLSIFMVLRHVDTARCLREENEKQLMEHSKSGCSAMLSRI